jgi:hypothetical protein
MKDKWTIFNAEAPISLMDRVLEKTSGGVCESAEIQLPDFVDGDLEDADRDLVSMHLEGCLECRVLKSCLRQLKVDLEDLREIEPSPEFAGRVIAATSNRFPVVQGLAAIWRRLIERPRFAYEFAYIGTVALMLVFWLVGGENMHRRGTELSHSVPVFVKTSVASGQALVGQNTQALKDRTTRLSEWTRDKWTVFAGRFEEPKENKRRSNHD